MTIATLCRREIITIEAGDSLRDAALRMREYHVGALAVTRIGSATSTAPGLPGARHAGHAAPIRQR